MPNSPKGEETLSVLVTNAANDTKNRLLSDSSEHHPKTKLSSYQLFLDVSM